ncbi:Rhamnulokinase [Roseimaritima multifibrata]|uniref:Rhamnulokinase n=1 Tax=Roseimaritima multifibrata TaxID=1930274 RepID=A0A517MEZ8_9BACT|nr:rhamnulokinase family protein [Roseimaritima multifibrata]QDS93347.1 Rhamnulokinase [Roseimaritima multifibrata]
MPATELPVPDCHFAIDLGASGGRVIAGRIEAGRLELETIHRFANNPVFVQSTMQWDTLGLWREILHGLTLAAAQCKEQGSMIRSVGVDTWGVDYVLLGRDNQPVAPVFHYRDSRNRGIPEQAFQIVPREDIFAATGLQFMDINTLYQLLSAKFSNAPALETAESMILMADYFHWLLTGKRSVEYTNASTTQLLNPNTKDWAFDLIERFELPKKLFGPISQPGVTLGPVQDSVAQQTGLENVPVVLPATHDTGSAVLAVPAEDFAPENPDWCYISSGTWSLMGCELANPLINDRCAELNFTNEGGVQGSTRLLKNIGGLWVFQQIRAALERKGEAVSWESMVAEADQAEPFGLVIDPDHNDFLAPKDMVDAIVQFADKSGQTKPANNGVLYRAALEGLALRYRVCLQMLESLTGNPIKTIYVVGGGSLNELLCQMTADACQRVVVAGPGEATATGNVLMQMIGCGVLQSVEEARKLVRESIQPKVFQPQNKEAWDQAADAFEKYAG